MVRRGRRKAMDPSTATKYHRVAKALAKTAGDLSVLAEDGDGYGNAIAIVAIHAAIAHADALSIAFGGFKSTEGDHDGAVDTLLAALGSRSDPAQVRLLRSIIAEKDTVSYQGIYFTTDDARAVVARLEAFAAWADQLFQQRP